MGTSENDERSKPDELGLEPVDVTELKIDDPPMVEIAVLSRRGMGFWKALIWSLWFLLIMQILPSLVLFVVFYFAESKAINQRIEAGETSTTEAMPPFVRRVIALLEAPELKQWLVVFILTGPACGILFSARYIPRVVGRDWRRRLAFRLPHLQHVVLVALLVIPFLIFNAAITTFIVKSMGKTGEAIIKAISSSTSILPVWVIVLGVAIGPAISEELFCRGLLGSGLVGRYGVWWGSVAAGFVFGFIHLNPLQFPVAMLTGIALQLIYIASRSIWVTICFHFLHNLLIGISGTKEYQIPLVDSLEQAYSFQPGLMLFAAGLMAVAIGWAFACSRVRIWMADGSPAPANIYPHVELPVAGSANHAVPGPIPTSVVLSVLVTTAFFTAVWFGL